MEYVQKNGTPSSLISLLIGDCIFMYKFVDLPIIERTRT